MKLYFIKYIPFVIFLFICLTHSQKHQVEDNDFAEFEDFDEDSVKPELKPHVPSKPEENIQETESQPSTPSDDDDEAIVEEEDNDEQSHLSDEDEFIGYEKKAGSKFSKTEEPKITIAQVPLHLRSNWDSFYLEMMMLCGIGIYFMNFMYGRAKNQKIASTWFTTHKYLLESNFALVGDDGKTEIENHGLNKMSENNYVLWCSGRTLMEGMLVEIRLLKRQDLIACISQIMKPSSDQLAIKININDMDSFVFAVALKKTDAKVLKNMSDIISYCPEKKAGEKCGIGSQYIVHSELGEASNAILKDPKLMAVMKNSPNAIDYIHLSDQYSGPKQQEGEAQPTAPSEVKKMLLFGFNFAGKGKISPNETFEDMIPLMQLVLHFTDKLSKFRLSKDVKARAMKNRAKVEEAYLKATHAARAEMAQAMREEKKRKEREKIMNLEDPELQRKLEEKEQRKQMKKRTPKMRTLKIKPM